MQRHAQARHTPRFLKDGGQPRVERHGGVAAQVDAHDAAVEEAPRQVEDAGGLGRGVAAVDLVEQDYLSTIVASKLLGY